ncbi:MAG TPA: polyhydroxyalkanoic acid system family protein [Stellaceae bacterium]|nr:polyhydroxyalkanoic acid system family protein [Stellaceae bacterium]
MITSTEPLTVTISHRLGRVEARRRLDNGIGAIRKEAAQYVRSLDYTWEGDRLDFRASVMFQTITGRIEIYEEFVRVELGLPRLLHLVAKTIASRIERQGQTLLEPPKSKG